MKTFLFKQQNTPMNITRSISLKYLQTNILYYITYISRQKKKIMINYQNCILRNYVLVIASEYIFFNVRLNRGDWD